jgi:hypothetical protein
LLKMAEVEKGGNQVAPSPKVELKEEDKNEYIKIINKKIRSLSKKVTKVAEIEKKMQTGSAINDEQKQLVAKKDQTAKSLKEFNSIREQLSKVHLQETKAKKKEERKEKGEAGEQLRSVVDLLQVSSLLASSPNVHSALSGVVQSQDLQAINTFASFITHRQLGSTSDAAVDSVAKFLNQSEEAVSGTGVTYKRLREQLAVILASSALNPQKQAEVVVSDAGQNEQAVERPASPIEQFSELPEEASSSAVADEHQTPEQNGAVEEGAPAEQGQDGAQTKQGAFQKRGGYRGRGRGQYRGRGGRGGFYDGNNANANRGEGNQFNRGEGNQFNRGGGEQPRGGDNRRGGGNRGRGGNRGGRGGNRGGQQQYQPQQQQQQQQ